MLKTVKSLFPQDEESSNNEEEKKRMNHMLRARIDSHTRRWARQQEERLYADERYMDAHAVDEEFNL